MYSIKDACTISMNFVLVDDCNDKTLGANIGLLSVRTSTNDSNKTLRSKKEVNTTGIEMECKAC
jgi:hypothetical protein